jgi:hypothetical protein
LSSESLSFLSSIFKVEKRIEEKILSWWGMLMESWETWYSHEKKISLRMKYCTTVRKIRGCLKQMFDPSNILWCYIVFRVGGAGSASTFFLLLGAT